jgi:excisionase family DNA binding protein
MKDISTNLAPERLMAPREVANLLGVSVDTLYAWRYRRVGPPALKVGRHLRYRPSEVAAWLDGQAGGEV